jgi:putative transposase
MKYRKKLLLHKELINFSKTICFEIGDKYYFDFDAIGNDGDHIYLFVGAEPKYSPSIVMQIIKSITARQMFKQYPEIKIQLLDGELWNDRGYIGTVGDGITSYLSKTILKIRETKRKKKHLRK